MKLKDLTIGTDPEMFLYDTQEERFKSAIGLIPGSKEEPFHPESLSEGFGLQTDNVLIEFNVPAVKFAHGCAFMNNIIMMKRYIQKFISNINNNYTLKCQASAHFDLTELADPQACEFGCDPDYNCYNQQINPSPTIHDLTLRSAGFHIHLGMSDPNIADCLKLLRYIDLHVGVPSVVIDPDTQRRSLYGKAGAFRFQPYGIEWRVLSSYFLQNEKTLSFIYKQLARAIQAFEDSEPLPQPIVVIKTINKSNKDKAMLLIEKYKITNELI